MIIAAVKRIRTGGRMAIRPCEQYKFTLIQTFSHHREKELTEEKGTGVSK